MTAYRVNHKLSFRYFGLYKIIKRINPVAYEVQLLPKAKIHPVFHVSQVRRALKEGMSASIDLPVPADTIYPPVKLLARRWRQNPTGRREQVQVQWPAGDIKDVT
jgi:hypothetical protein